MSTSDSSYVAVVYTALLTRNPRGHRNVDDGRSGHRREPMQTVNKLLLLSMFAFAARYALQDFAEGNDRMRAGDHFATDARRLLSKSCTFCEKSAIYLFPQIRYMKTAGPPFAKHFCF